MSKSHKQGTTPQNTDFAQSRSLSGIQNWQNWVIIYLLVAKEAPWLGYAFVEFRDEQEATEAWKLERYSSSCAFEVCIMYVHPTQGNRQGNIIAP